VNHPVAEPTPHLVIVAYWAEGESDELVGAASKAVHDLKLPDARGAAVCFPKATVEDKTFRAILMKLDLADVAPSLIASFMGGPRDATGGEVESIEPILLDDGEYRFLEIGSDLDAVFQWHPTEADEVNHVS
jgi:hypothetical protein